MEWRDLQLYLLFTPELCRGEPWHTLEEALEAGVELVQWRRREPDPEGLERCLELGGRYGVPVIVNDHVQLALESGAAGAHVGQGDMPATAARRLLGPALALGVSTHDPEQAKAAIAAGADHLGFGPCFPTATKDYKTGQPREVLRKVLSEATVPVFAIGGIHAHDLPDLIAEGCTRVAVSGAILRARSPREEVEHLLSILRQAGRPDP